MTESPQKTPLEATLQRHVVLARVWLFWETYAPVFVSAALILGLFLVGTFVGLWERIGDPWRGLVLLTALAYIFRAAYRAQKSKKAEIPKTAPNAFAQRSLLPPLCPATRCLWRDDFWFRR